MRRLLSLLIVGTCLAAGVRAQIPDAASDINQLVSRLTSNPYDRQGGWSATARLLKLGDPALAALLNALRTDTYRSDHGNHSLIMEALEKSGRPAARALDDALTPAVLKGTEPDDQNFVRRSASVLGRIGADLAAAALLRIARDSPDAAARETAARALLGPWPPGNGVTWVGSACLGPRLPVCPFDLEAPRVAAAVMPLTRDLQTIVNTERVPRVRLVAAASLVRWADGPVRRAGEEALVTLARNADDYSAQQAIEFLGAFNVRAASEAIKTRAAASGATDSLRQRAAEALERLDDPAYVPLVMSLMRSGDQTARQWAFKSAARSRNVAFVPSLIEWLDDATGFPQNTPGSMNTTLDALTSLTFQELGRDPAAWRAWWAKNETVPWPTHLETFIDTRMAQIIRAEPWTMNAWIAQLGAARDPAMMSLLTAYMRHPRTDPGAISPNQSRGGGGPPAVLNILRDMVGHGSDEARQLLYECLAADTLWLVMDCPDVVATFDPVRAAERLTALIAPAGQPAWRRYPLPELVGVIRSHAAETLLALGNARAIPVIIESIRPVNGSERGGSAAISAWAANRLLRFYTQEDIGADLTTSDAPAAARREAYEAWLRWWDANKASFVVNVRAARVDLECCKV